MSIQRQLTNERMSQIVAHGGTVYLAGQVGDDLSAGIEQQTRETLANIERLLDLAGTDKSKLLSVTIYLKDIDADFAGMNAAYAEFFGTASQPNKPTRSTVQVAALAINGALVEIDVIAARPRAR